MKCEYCEIVEREGKAPILYIDEELVVAVKDRVLAPGQITVFPRTHYTILEMVPELVLAKCAVVANKVSMALFESVGCQGTNIIIANGIASGQSVPHFGIEVIPRIADDKVGLTWEGRQLSDDDFEIAVKALSEDIKNQQMEKAKKLEKGEEKAVVREDRSTSEDKVEKPKTKDQKVSPLVRSVRRIP